MTSILVSRASAGALLEGVMERVCLRGTGLFPSPEEIESSCNLSHLGHSVQNIVAVSLTPSARDWINNPTLLFARHQVDGTEPDLQSRTEFPLTRKKPNAEKILGRNNLSELFGLDLVRDTATVAASSGPRAKSRKAKSWADEKSKNVRDARKDRDPRAVATTRSPRS